MTDTTTDWKSEAERLRALLDVSEQARQSALRALAEATEQMMDEHTRAERYLAERNAARLAEIERAEPADGCGACSDACQERASCRLARTCC